MNRSLPFILFLLTGALTTGQALGQTNSPGVPWGQLSPSEQRVLKPLKETWNQLPAERQQRMLKGAKRWSGMSLEQRQQAKQRLKQWKQLDSQRKERIRKRFNKFREMPREKRQALRQKRRWFKSLPNTERQKLRQEFLRQGKRPIQPDKIRPPRPTPQLQDRTAPRNKPSQPRLDSPRNLKRRPPS